MNYLSICAIAKHELPYIEEWFKYHAGIGVEHFYIYDNSDNNELLKFISPTINIFPIKGTRMQPYVYRECLKYYRLDTRWLAFIDVDEFIVPRSTDSLKEFLVPYEKHSAVCPHWKFFGSSGHQKYENKPVLERFTRCQEGVNEHIKSIVNPRKTFEFVTPHKFTHTTPAVDEHENPIEERDSRPKPYTADLIQINHYVTKSIEECVARRKNPRPDTGEIREINSFLAVHDRNEAQDLRALELWRKL